MTETNPSARKLTRQNRSKKTQIKTAVLLNTLIRISVTNNRAVCLHTYCSTDTYKMVFTS